jgi:hypothetical protein
MTQTKHITIKAAARLSGKSIQTIRRMLKAKKIKFKKDRTPQGFNYLIERDSLIEYFNLQVTDEKKTEPSTVAKAQAQEAEAVAADAISKEQAQVQKDATQMVVAPERDHQRIVQYEPVKEFNETIQKIIDQHGKEKENLFKLVESFQNKVISLENKLKAENASAKKWYQLW